MDNEFWRALLRLRGGPAAAAREVGVDRSAVTAGFAGRYGLGLVKRALLEEHLGAPQGVPAFRLHVLDTAPPHTDLRTVMPRFVPAGGAMWVLPWSLARPGRGRPPVGAPRRPVIDAAVVRSDSLALLLRCPRGGLPAPEDLGGGVSWAGAGAGGSVLAVPPSDWARWADGAATLADVDAAAEGRLASPGPIAGEDVLQAAADAAGWTAADVVAVLVECARLGLSADRARAALRDAGTGREPTPRS